MVACPDREPLICISSARYGRYRAPTPGVTAVCRPVQAFQRLLLALLLLLCATGALTLQDLLSVLVHLKLGDDDLGGGDGNGNGLAVGLLADDWYW
jgi:hypothetical protein